MAQGAGEQIGDAAIQALASDLDVHPTQVEQACEFADATGTLTTHHARFVEAASLAAQEQTTIVR